jgi:hypothetical protein
LLYAGRVVGKAKVRCDEVGGLPASCARPCPCPAGFQHVCRAMDVSTTPV